MRVGWLENGRAKKAGRKYGSEQRKSFSVHASSKNVEAPDYRTASGRVPPFDGLPKALGERFWGVVG